MNKILEILKDLVKRNKIATILIAIIALTYGYVGSNILVPLIVLVCIITRSEIASILKNKIRETKWLRWCVEFSGFAFISILLSIYNFHLIGDSLALENQNIIWIMSFLSLLTGTVSLILFNDRRAVRRVSKFALFLAFFLIFLNNVAVGCSLGGGC